jgi:superfamily I DNA/RNA helicase
MFKPSKYQKAVYNEIKNGKSNILVNAVAGSGKTTTILNAMEFIPSNQKVLFLAFNKTVAEELKERIGAKNVEVSTFHSVCFKALRFKGRRKVDGKKMNNIINEMIEDKAERYQYFSAIKKLVSVAKNEGVGFLMENNADTYHELITKYSVIHPKAECDLEVLINYSIRAYNASLEDSYNIDFDDMVLFCLKEKPKFKWYKYVFVDEAQDLNQVQIALLDSIKKNGRLVAVGDPNQAIYGFRGADNKAFWDIQKKYFCKILPLSVTYRCPKEIVQEAKEHVSSIESGIDRVGQVIHHGSFNKDIFSEKDSAILSRKTSKLISFAYSLMRHDVPCKILGKDLSANIVKFVKGFKSPLVKDLMLEMKKELDKEENQDDITLHDKIVTVEVFYENLSKTVSERVAPYWPVAVFCSKIEQFFEQCKTGIPLCTVHKAKGLEWDNVFILDRDDFMPRWATGQQIQQEKNIVYVAVTRAKSKLHYISSRNLEDKPL